MNPLDQLLFSHNAHEIAQLQQQDFVADFPELKIDHQNHIPAISQQLFGANKNVYISKHSRFADYPTHTHQFLEINYVYHGQCCQIINGKEYQFQAGDIILMDSESTQSIKALGEEDILINILLRNKNISLDWLSELQEHNSNIYKLLLSATISESHQANFAIFPSEKTEAVLPVLQQLITEYFFPTDFSDTIIEHYLDILIYLLARTLSEVKQEQLFEKADSPYLNALHIINEEYETLRLSDLAERLNFNKNYLSNLIKEESGKTFTELITQRKLLKAKLLLESTQLSIQEAAELAGFSNRSYFYRKFKEEFNCHPSACRDKTKP